MYNKVGFAFICLSCSLYPDSPFTENMCYLSASFSVHGHGHNLIHRHVCWNNNRDHCNWRVQIIQR